MTNTEALNKKIHECGYKKGWLAEQLGLSGYGFALKINNRNQFTAIEIQRLCKLLHIVSLEEKDRIFFADDVDV